jgi:hypothetical protein
MPPPETAVTRLVHDSMLSRAEFGNARHPAVDRQEGTRRADSKRTRAVRRPAPRFETRIRRRLQTRTRHSALSVIPARSRAGGLGQDQRHSTRTSAEIDCRLLPDRDPGEFPRRSSLIDDPRRGRRAMRFKPGESTIDTPPFRAIAAAAQRIFLVRSSCRRSRLRSLTVITFAITASSRTATACCRDPGRLPASMVATSDCAPGNCRCGTLRLVELLRSLVY